MIGIEISECYQLILQEFFELFKVPWEICQGDRDYDVLITTLDKDPGCNAKLKIIYTQMEPEGEQSDASFVTDGQSGDYAFKIPVYCGLSKPNITGIPILFDSSGDAVGVRVDAFEQRILYLGYDLFAEAEYLLVRGQPVENAAIPTLDLHISLLRQWILEAGLPLVEIPPVPSGYKFLTCLTHDVDFIGIKNHPFDWTFFGFVSRVIPPLKNGGFISSSWWRDLSRNIRALFSVPLVYLGLTLDFWRQFKNYVRIEKDTGSTFFFIPLKDHPGKHTPGETGLKTPPKLRATRYDLQDHEKEINFLLAEGKEIGVHGIDSWKDLESGVLELETLRNVATNRVAGIRMHWLYFSEETPKLLEKAGYCYDSSLGYNETVGFRCGTTQAFRLHRTEDMMELPLHIQDTALFYRRRMNMSETKAFKKCALIFQAFGLHGGVLTLNWHQRSLGPERNWDRFYIKLVETLRAKGAWFASCSQAADWFRWRRSALFDVGDGSNRRVVITSKIKRGLDLPIPFVRLYIPCEKEGPSGEGQRRNFEIHDYPFSKNGVLEIDLQ